MIPSLFTFNAFSVISDGLEKRKQGRFPAGEYTLYFTATEEDRTLLAAELYTHRERYLFRRLDGAL